MLWLCLRANKHMDVGMLWLCLRGVNVVALLAC